jgi:hypothetical protein
LMKAIEHNRPAVPFDVNPLPGRKPPGPMPKHSPQWWKECYRREICA